ncbi:ATP-binding protein [Xanthomonas fragariae]|uniref:ATP-binding protein n=1 Tax=Xanthomonas fragariae TaxID=48664 RepID=UPI001ABDDD1E|nr:ATP-binding protein [Xanthomonas fragariae]UKR52806.1 hypothetical protein K4A87_01345 [Xanthomonas fragariae]
MHTGITAAGLTLHVEGFEAPLHIDSDERRLQQLLSNVLKNALRYTNAASQLQVRWARRRRRLEIVIEDSAPDVAPDKSEVFVRALLPRRRLAHGLGLAICRNIVVAHDGQISATPSALGRLCVTLRLPALEA